MIPAAPRRRAMDEDTAPCPPELVELAEALVDAAGSVVRRYFRSGLSIDDKPDATPVTAADREAETAIRERIAEACPGHGVIGEEHGEERAEAEYVWVLDPIDGTKRFATGHPGVGTLVALLHDGRPILGIIDMPILGERWIGAAGRRTRRRDRSGLHHARTRPCPTPAEAALAATSPAMFRDADAKAFARLEDAARITVYGGDCYNYALLASGWLDLVAEATMAPYDFLAQVPVIEGAGGTITDWQGRPLGLASDGRVLAAGDPRSHAAALRLLAG
jgi:histidinol phosphatase-like enzyme (inositol monophosphatase family)